MVLDTQLPRLCAGTTPGQSRVCQCQPSHPQRPWSPSCPCGVLSAASSGACMVFSEDPTMAGHLVPQSLPDWLSPETFILPPGAKMQRGWCWDCQWWSHFLFSTSFNLTLLADFMWTEQYSVLHEAIKLHPLDVVWAPSSQVYLANGLFPSCRSLIHEGRKVPSTAQLGVIYPPLNPRQLAFWSPEITLARVLC